MPSSKALSRPAALASPGAVAAATITAAGAMTTLGTRGLLPAAATSVAVVLTLLAGTTLALWPAPKEGDLRRKVAQPLVVVGTLVTLVVAQRRATGSTPDRSEVAELLTTTLTYPLTLLMLLQLVYAATAREVGVVVVAASLCLLLALGTDTAGDDASVLTSSGLASTATLAAGLVTLWLLHRLRERAGAHHVVHGRRTTDAGAVLLVAAALAAGALALLLPAPDGIRAASSSGFGQGTGATGGTQGTPRLLNYLNPSMDLNSRGELPTEPLLAVPLDSPTLWGGSVLDRYDGRTWSATPSSPIPLPLDAAGAYDARPGATGGLAPGAAERADPVRLLSTGAALPVVSPGALVSVQSPVQLLRFDSQVAMMGRAEAYLVRSTATVADGPTPADTAVPTHVPQRVHRLAVTLTRDAPTVEAKVAAIEAYLLEHMRYRLEAPVAPDGADPVDFFLFEAREGFCEHFASAAAVMLRSVGVPARVVTGFAGGEPDGNVRVITGEQAHAWVQVHAGGDEWFWTDPTEGATLASEDAVAGFLEQHGTAVAAAITILVLTTGAVVLLVRVVRRRAAARRAAAAPLPTKVLAAFASLERVLSGSPLARRPEQSVAEFARTLRSRWPGGLPDPEASEAAFTAVQLLAYGPGDPPDADLHLALQQLRSLTEQARQQLRDERRRTGWRRLLPANRSSAYVSV